MICSRPSPPLETLQSKLGVFDLLRRHVPHSVATKLSPLAECLERKEPFDASRVTDLVTDFRRDLYTTTGNSVRHSLPSLHGLVGSWLRLRAFL